MTLAPRSGTAPTTSDDGPHRQVDQLAPPALWGELVAAATALPGVVEGHSQVSPASSRALFLREVLETREPSSSLAPVGQRLEPVHLHGVDDTSIHLCLPPDRAEQVCALGWGEPHQYGDYGTETMVYGPRDDAELAVVLGLVESSLAFARAANS
ncbi:MAG: hypothetical protein JJE50_08130 [Actinomycetales bacterium]|nr:hypothetical protein [Actinomycetales bacterium]